MGDLYVEVSHGPLGLRRGPTWCDICECCRDPSQQSVDKWSKCTCLAVLLAGVLAGAIVGILFAVGVL